MDTASQNHDLSASALVSFNFHGDQLDVATVNGEHFVVLARLCEPFGLRVDGQAEKLRGLRWAGTQKIWVPDPQGNIQETFCLSIRSVAGWLFTLNPGKVAEHLRDKLVDYQTRCADALADHFLGRRVSPEEAALYAALSSRVEGLETQMAALARRPPRPRRLASAAAPPDRERLARVPAWLASLPADRPLTAVEVCEDVGIRPTRGAVVLVAEMLKSAGYVRGRSSHRGVRLRHYTRPASAPA